ncbi:helix-turn-helix transcriptional regulator [Actinophytocola sp.]|uniref:helix-turn-helix domain-containing protein n=1 Tax=Actinophytocola sp. TaxID=1872138 RepID=UPI002ED49648
MTAMGEMDREIGTLLRHWRQRQRRSQLDVALAVGVSARHLSFVETGRSRPSRALLLRLAAHLDVPLRERNDLLLAAGLAPAYPAHKLDDDELAGVRTALESFLASQEPNPTLVFNRRGDLLLTNQAVWLFLDDIDEAVLLPRPNVYRIVLHPKGMAPRLRNRSAWATHLEHRLAWQASAGGDPYVVNLLEELRGYPALRQDHSAGDQLDHKQLMLPIVLDTPVGDLTLYSIVTKFGSPFDVTLAEIAIESFFPADAENAARLAELSARRSGRDAQRSS